MEETNMLEIICLISTVSFFCSFLHCSGDDKKNWKPSWTETWAL